MKSQSVLRFSLNESIDKVSSFKAPSFGKFWRFDLSLFGEHVLSDLISSSSVIRSFSSHEFISDDSECKEIRDKAVILAADDLRRHVPWSATGIRGIIDSECSCNTQISNSNITPWIKNQVLRLDVTMNDVATMHMLKAQNYTCHKKFYLNFIFTWLDLTEDFIADMVPQVAALHQVEYQIQCISVLKSVMHVD